MPHEKNTKYDAKIFSNSIVYFVTNLNKEYISIFISIQDRYNNSFFVLIGLHILPAYDIDISYMLWFVYTLHEHDYTIDHMFNDSCFHTDGQAFFIFSYSEQYHNRKLNNYKLIVYHHTRRPRSILSSLFVVYIIHLNHVYAV